MKINNPQYITFYIDENFEYILTQIYRCYEKMLVDYEFVENNENKIKNRLFKDYLDNQDIKEELELTEFLFATENASLDDNYNEKGYADIQVYDLLKYKKDTQAYYVIECKRLDDINPNYQNSLNNKYIKEGIQRYIDEKYKTNFSINGMLAFVVKMNDIEINCQHFADFTPYKFIDNLDFSYRSNHTTKSNKKFTLYHLMLDFRSKISSN